MPFEFPHTQSKKNIAVIGAGISGMGAAHLLAKYHNVTLYEAENRIGGHARTVMVGSNNDKPVDTGFIVYNELNYPNLVGFFKWLEVETISSDMSFAVSARDGDLEYSGSLIGLFAQKKNYFNLNFYIMLKDIFVFFVFGYKYAFLVNENETLKPIVINEDKLISELNSKNSTKFINGIFKGLGNKVKESSGSNFILRLQNLFN